MGYREVQQREEGTEMCLGKRVRGFGHSQGTRSRVSQPHGLSPGSALHPWPQADSEGIHLFPLIPGEMEQILLSCCRATSPNQVTAAVT